MRKKRLAARGPLTTATTAALIAACSTSPAPARADSSDTPTATAMLAAGYAIAGSSYDPNASQWALNTAVSDQFGALAAVEATVLPHQPAHVLAFGTGLLGAGRGGRPVGPGVRAVRRADGQLER